MGIHSLLNSTLQILIWSEKFSVAVTIIAWRFWLAWFIARRWADRQSRRIFPALAIFCAVRNIYRRHKSAVTLGNDALLIDEKFSGVGRQIYCLAWSSRKNYNCNCCQNSGGFFHLRIPRNKEKRKVSVRLTFHFPLLEKFLSYKFPYQESGKQSADNFLRDIKGDSD